MKILLTILLLTGASLTGAAIYVYAGFFNVAADEPHSAIVHSVMQIVRTRSIAVRAGSIEPPPLDDPTLIASGARHYDAMCRGCHLAPGQDETEIRGGLYPRPPDLSMRVHSSPAENFWVIKHGIKMSGMPAWGKSHDDQSIWGLVAFVRKLPKLDPAQYRALAKAEVTPHHRHTHE